LDPGFSQHTPPEPRVAGFPYLAHPASAYGRNLERKLTEEDVRLFHHRFRSFATPLRESAVADFGKATWRRGPSESAVTPARERDPVRDAEAVRRRAAVNSYLDAMLQKTGKRLRRKDIWKAVGYETRTEFERWERNDRRANKSAHERFTLFLTKT
jgi:hypothetical protein